MASEKNTWDPWLEYEHLCRDAGMFKTMHHCRKIEPTDALVVVDMQNDFLVRSELNPHGGKFGVAGGEYAAELIVELIGKFAAAGAVIVATRDYHPVDHVSFAGNSPGAVFPPHCIQGSPGARFYSPVKKALEAAREEGANVIVAFKGFHEDTDSFGSFMYPTAYTAVRPELLVRRELVSKVQGKAGCSLRPRKHAHVCGCEALPWTGSFVLKQSYVDHDLDAPPDVLAAMHSVQSLAYTLRSAEVRRIFCCGLALDYCVLDTAVTARAAGFDDVFFIVDAARPAYLRGIGETGSGFLHSAKQVQRALQVSGTKAIRTETVLDDNRAVKRVTSSAAAAAAAFKVATKFARHALAKSIVRFPDKLGPIPLRRIPLPMLGAKQDIKLGVRVSKKLKGMVKSGSGSIRGFRLRRAIPETASDTAVMGLPGSPVAPLPQSAAKEGIAASATQFRYLHPIPGVENMADQTIGHLATNNVVLSLLVFGGFAYFDDAGALVDVKAIATGLHGEAHEDLDFGAPVAIGLQILQDLHTSRVTAVTLTDVRSSSKGKTHTCSHCAWLNPGETFKAENGTDVIKVPELGAVAFFFHAKGQTNPMAWAAAEDSPLPPPEAELSATMFPVKGSVVAGDYDTVD